MISPLIRWAGSKRQLLPHLRTNVPPTFDRYVEPFAGSACLFFGISPSRALISDINSELMMTYRAVRRDHRALHDMIESWPISASFYYDLRTVPSTSLSAMERAARFLYLNRYSFNGVYRTNAKGEFNVPRGIKTGPLPSREQFQECASVLRGATIRSGDFQEVVESTGRGDFVYLDPPYRPSITRNRGEYGAGSFCSEDLQRFLKAVKGASSRGAKILISYFNNPALAYALEGWQAEEICARRHVAGFAKDRKQVTELLLRNY